MVRISFSQPKNNVANKGKIKTEGIKCRKKEYLNRKVLL